MRWDLLLLGGIMTVSSARAGTSTPTLEAKPTLEQKIGQMLMVGFRGLEIAPGSAIARDLAERNLGGVILFDRDLPTASDVRNIASPAQVRALNDSARRLARTPLLTAVDQEGGFVARLKPKHGFPATLSALKMAMLPAADFVAKADEAARTIADAGFNLNFAPVVDVNVNPESPAVGKWERSYSADPAVVAEKAAGIIAAHHRHGVLTSLKHFPGHGSSRADSHLGITDVTDTWQPYELEPFERLVRGGRVDTIMTAHVFNGKLDEEYPATLSRKVIGDLLRGRIGFGGVVFTDDLQMRAITDHFGLEKAIQLSLEAGADVLTFGNNLVYDEHITEKVIGIVAGLVRSGALSEHRIDESYERIGALKQRLR